MERNQILQKSYCSSGFDEGATRGVTWRRSDEGPGYRIGNAPWMVWVCWRNHPPQGFYT